MRVHIIIKDDVCNSQTVQAIIDACSLTNVNEGRLKFFNYSLITADITDEGLKIAYSMNDLIKSIEIDGIKTV